ncbi:Aminoacyl-tRNA synthetase class Ia anticodon-binding [Arabidopsis thaliana x Arabidopsis arenosa]|uniref:Aminoacyl-tRNA synthetase class Ia anticodon-binding n=1 Tax=Arabidopsis thaliana x Arabidopsis arenosa TaxID=1240361 RepID=A0A8T1YBC1_9BRAS|nr:Aminoacyl-tRNA synthetase class Ia anticodon-binding [Arabidopsis thaliana x Arabidopsis arenosa]
MSRNNIRPEHCPWCFSRRDEIHQRVNHQAQENAEESENVAGGALVEVEKAVREVLDVLGLLTTLIYADFLKEMKQKALARAKLGEEEVLQKIETRRVARMNNNFELSDGIRGSLALQGISLMDVPGRNTLWRLCLPSGDTSLIFTQATPH